MQVEKTGLPGVLALTPQRFRDERGYFAEIWTRKAQAHVGIAAEFVQENQSLSSRSGTLRGLHFQSPPHAQGKLVRCARGALFDVAIDVRRGSLTYGKWEGHELTAETGRQLWIPPGFLHGFLTLEDDTEVVYKCTDYYAPQSDGTVRWDSCGIDWPLSGTPILSKKDANAPPLSDFTSPFSVEESG